MDEKVILPHEHIFCRYRSSDKPQALTFVGLQLQQLAHGGVTDIVDLTAYTNPLSYKDFLAASPVRIHSCVGFYLENYVRKAYRSLPVADLVAVLERKVRRLRTVVPPVAIKIAARSASLSPFERRAFAAAAQFHRVSGLPIVTHSPRGFEQHQSFLLELGVSSDRIMLSHPEMSTKGRFAISADEALASMMRCLELGSYLCFTDLTGLASRADATRLDLLKSIVRAGYANRMLVSGDSSWRIHRNRATVQNSSSGKDYRLALEVHAKLERAALPGRHLSMIRHRNASRFFGLT